MNRPVCSVWQKHEEISVGWSQLTSDDRLRLSHKHWPDRAAQARSFLNCLPPNFPACMASICSCSRGHRVRDIVGGEAQRYHTKRFWQVGDSPGESQVMWTPAACRRLKSGAGWPSTVQASFMCCMIAQREGACDRLVCVILPVIYLCSRTHTDHA